jgi:hypothetical protein
MPNHGFVSRKSPNFGEISNFRCSLLTKMRISVRFFMDFGSKFKNIRVKLWLKNEIRCGKNEIVNSDTNPAMNYIQFITIALIYVRRPPFSISFQLAVPKQAMCRALPHILASIQGKTSSRYVGSWAIPFRKFLQLASVSPKSLTSTFKRNQQGIPTLNV